MNVRIPDADGTHRHGITAPRDPSMPVLSVGLDTQGQYVLTAQDDLGGSHRVTLTEDASRQLHLRAAALITETEAKERETAMEVSIHRHRWANMGDHAVLAQEAVKYDPTETVEALVLRVLDLRAIYARHDSMDHIVLRVVEGTEPERPSLKVGASPLDF